MANAIEIAGLAVTRATHFWSKPRTVLCGVDLVVYVGECVGFLGANGAGKTTTIKCILGLLRPNAGRISVLGGSIAEMGIRRRVGFMPENAQLPAQLTALEYVGHHARLAGMGARAAAARSTELLSQLGLSESAQALRMAKFSKGMLQRTGIAQALVADPDLVILDEPMSGLDPMGRRDIRTAMEALKARGKTIFFSTHILPDAELICDRVAILDGGRIHKVGLLEELVGAGGKGTEIDLVVSRVPDSCRAQVEGLSAVVTEHAQGVGLSLPDYARANQVIDLLRRAGCEVWRMDRHRGTLEDVVLGGLH
jgi:ABC-2 type transport system ATP-binding protein